MMGYRVGYIAWPLGPGGNDLLGRQLLKVRGAAGAPTTMVQIGLEPVFLVNQPQPTTLAGEGSTKASVEGGGGRRNWMRSRRRAPATQLRPPIPHQSPAPPRTLASTRITP